MTVILDDTDARTIARLLAQFDSAMAAEYNSGQPQARHWADELKSRAGPPREPIRDWASERLDVPDDDLGYAVDAIVAAIETHETNTDAELDDVVDAIVAAIETHETNTDHD